MGGGLVPSSTGIIRRLSNFTLLVPFVLLLLPLFLYLQCTAPQAPSTSELRGSELINSALNDRGAALLHSWTDEELIHRALALQNRSTSAVLPQTLIGRATSMIRLGRRARHDHPLPPKVAFLFLTTGGLPFEPLWNRFFHGHERLYNLYVHVDPFDFQAFNRSSGSVFWGRVVPSMRTARGSPLLVSAMKRLLANALIDDEENRYFVMLSDSCIPLHGFRRVYKRLTSSNRSFLEVIKDSQLLWSRYNARGEGVMLPEVPYELFTVGSQWFVLTRDHARLLVGEERMWSKFRLPCLPEASSFGCFTEEHYFSTVLNSVEPNGSHGYTLTYVHWPVNTDGHPTTFHAGDVNRELIRRLQEEKDGRYMFGRKFARDCLEALLRLGDVILKH